MRLTLMYFSPTRTTKKLVSAVGKVFFERLLCETRIADITPLAARMREYTFGEDDVLIFGAPVYGGRVPPLLLPFIEKLRGGGARAVALSVSATATMTTRLRKRATFWKRRGLPSARRQRSSGSIPIRKRSGREGRTRRICSPPRPSGLPRSRRYRRAERSEKSCAGNRRTNNTARLCWRQSVCPPPTRRGVRIAERAFRYAPYAISRRIFPISEGA